MAQPRAGPGTGRGGPDLRPLTGDRRPLPTRPARPRNPRPGGDSPAPRALQGARTPGHAHPVRRPRRPSR
ncbi:hypothetical protein NOCARDAX2BIS_370055 [Nocardioides sp. AX2bis]|nr:hypothetical protein NOCARDAX2BIS_370055 [Nocardioides sp. AX2bis]